MEAAYETKSNHGFFPKECIEECLKEAPGRYHVALERKHPSGANLVAMDYRHNLKVTLLFTMSKNAGSTRKGSPYEMKFVDTRGNACIRLVDRLSATSNFF